MLRRFFLLAALALPATAPAADDLPQLFVQAERCQACHNGLVSPAYEDVSIGSDWQASIMAHASKDPYWQASVRRETTMHPESAPAIEDECAACHMPMTRFRARAAGEKGKVFAHLPFPAAARTAPLAAEGVSCSLCHQIEGANLGSPESFTAGFQVDTEKPPGKRPAYGPYEIEKGRKTIMRSAAELVPKQGRHVQDAAFCATCHTLYTHTRGPGGEIIGTLPEQVPYLEWLHSDYRDVQACQSCHMKVVNGEMPLASVLGPERKGFSRHIFRGGNFFMQRLLIRYGPVLGVTTPAEQLTAAARITVSHLQDSSARLAIEEATITEGRLRARVALVNEAGHKLPTAYPSRRAWVHFTVKDSSGQLVFESGRLNPDGSITGNDNDRDPTAYEPHYTEIVGPDEVQIYEPILATPDGAVTTGLLAAIRYQKDNRLLPHGFVKERAPEDIAVQGRAAADPDFTGGGDTIVYTIPLEEGQKPFTVEAELLYQPIGFRWARNLLQQEAAETIRFTEFYDAMSERSATVLARDKKRVP